MPRRRVALPVQRQLWTCITSRSILPSGMVSTTRSIPLGDGACKLTFRYAWRIDIYGDVAYLHLLTRRSITFPSSHVWGRWNCIWKCWTLLTKTPIYALNPSVRQARLGVVECASHELLTSYPVMFAHRGETVAHFKCTVLLLASGTSKVRLIGGSSAVCMER